MTRRSLRSRAADAVAAWVGGGDTSDRVARSLEQVQTMRSRAEEVEAALLHFWLLPARADLRAVRRRVHRLRRQVRSLESELLRLEDLVERGRSRPGGGA